MFNIQGNKGWILCFFILDLQECNNSSNNHPSDPLNQLTGQKSETFGFQYIGEEVGDEIFLCINYFLDNVQYIGEDVGDEIFASLSFCFNEILVLLKRLVMTNSFTVDHSQQTKEDNARLHLDDL